MSHHHILPPITYTAEPPKLKETKRRRRIGTTQGTDATDEMEETGESSSTAPAYSAALPQHQRPVEAVERRNQPPSGKLSRDTLSALLAAQEENGQG